MTEILRPMSTGELLDQTFSLYKRHFMLFAGVVLPGPAILLAVQLAELALTKGVTGPMATNPALILANIPRIVSGFIVGAVAYIAGMAITAAATVRVVSAVHLSRPMTIGEAYGGLKGRFLRVVLIAFCWFLASSAAALVMFLGAAVVMGLATAAGTFLGTLGKVISALIDIAALFAAFILFIWVMARYSLPIQACVVENTKVFASFRRSAVLAKGSILRIVIVYLLFVVINFAIGVTVQLAAGIAAAPLHSSPLVGAIQALAGFFVGVVVAPLATVAMSLVYYDERVRKEAFDLQLMMAALDGPQVNTAAATS